MISIITKMLVWCPKCDLSLSPYKSNLVTFLTLLNSGIIWRIVLCIIPFCESWLFIEYNRRYDINYEINSPSMQRLFHKINKNLLAQQVLSLIVTMRIHDRTKMC